MTEVVLFHHVQGLTPGIRALADAWRGAGHVVHLPDLLEGATFEDLDAGMAHARTIGFATLSERGRRAAEAYPDDVVWAGVSLGVMPAQQLAQSRPGARGAILIDACAPIEEFGDGWPEGVPVQVHGMDADPFFVDGGDLDAARALVEAASDAELLLYPGTAHLFVDASLPGHDAEATARLIDRTLAFLARAG